MKLIFTIAFCLFTSFLFSQLPDTDIWLFDLNDNQGKVSFSNAQNITNRKGYDNQPLFSDYSGLLFYTAQTDSGGPTDLYGYHLDRKRSDRLTKTPTSEYSPNLTPDRKYISVVMVEKDSGQRLWKFPVAGGQPVCIMKNVDSIGYYCWVDSEHVAIYVLTQPVHTLKIANIKTQQTILVADSIGKCIRRFNEYSIWYTTRSGHFYNVYEYSLTSNTSQLKGMIESDEFFIYRNSHPGYQIWSFSDNSIVSGFMNSKQGASEILDLEMSGIRKPSRLTVGLFPPDNLKLAVVGIK